MSPLLTLIKRHKAGENCGIYAVCSANVFVLEASILQAREDGSLLLVEATSNQVNQFGGYTGMKPDDFKQFIYAIAYRLLFPIERLILGGDHLGPNCWQDDSVEVAMQKSSQLIHDYVSAGFEKIHLDCSMPCADDVLPLADELIAERAAMLCQVAEEAYLNSHDRDNNHPPLYVIGTEVPIPGGAQESLETALEVTSVEAAKQTVLLHYDAFEQRHLDSAWQRVIALVVQPGVEFDHQSVIRYEPAAAIDLANALENSPLVYEAHSTDYQPAPAYSELVKDHFAILKVGPALTFALREVLFALADIENIMITAGNTSNLKEVLEQEMLQEPKYWAPYYQGNLEQQKFSRAYSFSDRCRYYWPNVEVTAAVNTLIANLSVIEIPITLLSQYLPLQYQAVMQAKLSQSPRAFIYHHIQQVIRQYANACGMHVDN